MYVKHKYDINQRKNLIVAQLEARAIAIVCVNNEVL